MRTFGMFIDGAWCEASNGATFHSVNPATEEIWAEFSDAPAEDVDRAVQAADRAFREGPWPKMSAAERGKVLRRIGAAIEPAAEELGLVETTDSGKLLRETVWQARNLKEVYEYYGGLADKVQGDIPPSPQGAPLQLVVREPLGVVAAVVPWNSQLHLAGFKIAPALAAGNTVVVKASEDASAAIVEFAKVIEAAGVPPGVVNVVTGGAACGQALVSHPLVRRVSFTGGVDTARKIIPATANNIAAMSLELGGKSPVIVFDDADLENAVNGILSAIFAATGQSCAAGSRLLVQDGIYDELLARLVDRANSIRIGDPTDPETQMGPLATKAQRDRIERLVAEAVSSGGRLLSGGGRPANRDRGYYFEPTIVAFENQEAELVRRELFGPVLSVLRFSSEEEAMDLARDTDFAFAGGVFSRDFAKAYRVSRAVPAGRIWMNTYRQTSLMVPFGGSKNSGYGREGGIDAVRDYTQTKGIFINVSGVPTPDPFVMR
ncbi:aldehyde dehydrogenase [Lutibaculum baratangense]|uniref:aldehyde dehydrogenase n=1 Tax=Lutibaculum baratangense TaxID=1358440 RepID=UPI00190F7D78|nr:aldehyde dehydrogenase [Lutibaculum baratangense]